MHGSLDVTKVKVDISFYGDEFGDALCGITQNAVGCLKGILDGDVSISIYVAKALVVDDEQRVYALAHLLHAFKSLDDFVSFLKEKGYGDDAYREDALALGYFRYDGGSSRACSSTHAGSDKTHLGVIIEELVDLVLRILGLLLSQLWIGPCPQTTVAQLYLDGHRRLLQALTVGIAHGKRYVHYLFTIHVIHSIAASTANTYHLDDLL